MPVSKIAVSLDRSLVEQIDRMVREGEYPSRSRAIQDALQERLRRVSRDRLARECAKLDPAREIQLADEGMAVDRDQWPQY